jgi:hypothetical protein
MIVPLPALRVVEEKYLHTVVNSKTIRFEAVVPEHTDGHINNVSTWTLGSRSIRGMGNIPPKLLEAVFGVRPVQVEIDGVDEDRLFFLTRYFGTELFEAGCEPEKLAVSFLLNSKKNDMRLYVSEVVGVEVMRKIANRVWEEFIDGLTEPRTQEAFDVRIDMSGNGEYRLPSKGFDLKTALEW